MALVSFLKWPNNPVVHSGSLAAGELSVTASPALYDTLPQNVTSAPSQTIFRKRLKTHLFHIVPSSNSL